MRQSRKSIKSEIPDHVACPCGSGKNYGRCCKKKAYKFMQEGEALYKQVPIPEQIVNIFEKEQELVAEYYGRKVTDDEYAFSFMPIYNDGILLKTVYALRSMAIPERQIYAYYKSDGLFLCSQNKKIVSDVDKHRFHELCKEFDSLMLSDVETELNSVKFVLFANTYIEENVDYVINVVINTLNNYMRRHSKEQSIREYRMKTEQDYCLFSALKTIKTLNSMKVLKEDHLSECIYALSRGILENYIYLCSINSDSKLFSEMLFPKVDETNYSFTIRKDGSIDYKRVKNNNTGEIRNIDVRIGELSRKLPLKADRQIYQALYASICRYVHVDVMSARDYFSCMDPYDEIDRSLIAYLIAGFLSVLLLRQISVHKSTTPQYKEDIAYLVINGLSERLINCFEIAKCDPEHQNDMFDLFLERLTVERNI